MRSKIGFVPASAALVLGVPALGQFTITPKGLNAGNGVFSNGPIPASLTGSGFTPAAFHLTDGLSTNHMFQDWWWFRASGDTREYAFANGSVPGGPACSGVVVGNTLGTLEDGGYAFEVTNATAGYSFTSNQLWNIVESAEGVYLVSGNTVRNTGTSPLSVSLFHYADVDLNGTSGDDAFSFAGDRFTVSDGVFSLIVLSETYDAYQADVFATLRDVLSDAVTSDLTNAVVGSPGDFTGAFQWNAVLNPGQAVKVMALMELVPAPGSAAILAMAGLFAARRRRE